MRDGTRKATMKRQCGARASINLFEFSESTPKLESDQTLSKKSRKANLWMLLTNSTWSVAHFWASTSPHTTVWSKTLPRVFQRLTPESGVQTLHWPDFPQLFVCILCSHSLSLSACCVYHAAVHRCCFVAATIILVLVLDFAGILVINACWPFLSFSPSKN